MFIDGVLNVGGDNVGYMLGVFVGADCVGFQILSFLMLSFLIIEFLNNQKWRNCTIEFVATYVTGMW